MLIGEAEHFWQKRYHDFNVRNQRQFAEKLGYTHRNPVKRGLCERPEGLEWSSFRHHAIGMKAAWRLNPSGPQKSANGQLGDYVRQWNCPTQAKTRLEWATRPSEHWIAAVD